MLRWALASTLLIVGTSGLVRADGEDYHDQDLTGKSFVQASLNRANFSGATIIQCDFTYASLKKANFKGAVAKTPTKFDRADASEADFTGVNKAQFGGETTLFFSGNCSLKDANLRKSKIKSISLDCDFSRAELQGANLRGAFFGASSKLPRFTDALYDEDTAFPEGFDPKAVGMKLKKEDKKDDKKKDDKE